MPASRDHTAYRKEQKYFLKKKRKECDFISQAATVKAKC